MLVEDLQYKIIEYDEFRRVNADLFVHKTELLNRFINDFPINSINNLSLEEYVIGLGSHTSFCYRLERELGIVGDMRGSFSKIFGVYYGIFGEDNEERYRATFRYGRTVEEAFSDVKLQITNLLNAELIHDDEAIEKNKIAELFKYKLLGTYFPDDYLNLYSSQHLDHFIRVFELGTDKNTFLDKQQVLFDFRDSMPIMADWSNLEYNEFLYKYWRPPSKTVRARLKEFENVPDTVNPQFVELEIISFPEDDINTKGTKKSGKPNFKSQAEKNTYTGLRGEEIVFKKEEELLKGTNFKPDHISKKDDFANYDILSYEPDGTPKYIEVKSTRNKLGQTSFYISEQELQKAKEEPNYHIYVVFETHTTQPKIWKLGNPFRTINPNIKISPTNHFVQINSKPQ